PAPGASGSTPWRRARSGPRSSRPPSPRSRCRSSARTHRSAGPATRSRSPRPSSSSPPTTRATSPAPSSVSRAASPSSDMTRTARTTTAGLLAVVVLAACGGGEDKEQATAPPPSPTTTAPAPAPTTEPTTTEPAPQEPEVLATGLDVPWGLAFLPDGTALVTERDTARVLELVAGQEPRELATVPGVTAENETGLLGIAVSPDFADNGHVFVYLTTATDNRVLRMVHDGERLAPDVVVLEGIPRETYHSGGRLEFGPDGFLYVATGDAAVPSTSQDPGSLGGKVLRVDEDGEPAPGNPDPGSPVWSLGHRNVQGLGWDAKRRMYASEFGQD